MATSFREWHPFRGADHTGSQGDDPKSDRRYGRRNYHYDDLTLGDQRVSDDFVSSAKATQGMGGEREGERLVKFAPPVEYDHGEEQPDLTDVLPMLERLTAKQRFVIECRYGLRGEVQTLREVADLMGVSHPAVLKIEKSALAALRRRSINHPLLS
jgi:DNA-directed RNA polymerase specialized sigma24 family protein